MRRKLIAWNALPFRKVAKKSPRSSPPLFVERLEDRWVPSSVHLSSDHYAAVEQTGHADLNLVGRGRRRALAARRQRAGLWYQAVLRQKARTRHCRWNDEGSHIRADRWFRRAPVGAGENDGAIHSVRRLDRPRRDAAGDPMRAAARLIMKG